MTRVFSNLLRISEAFMVKLRCEFTLNLFGSVIPELSDTIFYVAVFNGHNLVGDLRQTTCY